VVAHIWCFQESIDRWWSKPTTTRKCTWSLAVLKSYGWRMDSIYWWLMFTKLIIGLHIAIGETN
jgi:hypothetical protein